MYGVVALIKIILTLSKIYMWVMSGSFSDNTTLKCINNIENNKIL